MVKTDIHFTNIFTNSTIVIHYCPCIKTVDDYNCIVKRERLFGVQLHTMTITDKKLELVHFQTHIILSDEFNQQIVLNRDLEFIIFGMNYNTEIILTKKLMFITFGYHFVKHVVLPKNTLQLNTWNKFEQFILLPKYVVYLHFTPSSNDSHNLTKKIRYLNICTTLGNMHCLKISKNPVKIYFGHNYSHPIQLPKYLKFLQISNAFCKKVNPTKNLVFLSVVPDVKLCVCDILTITHVEFIGLMYSYDCYDICDNLPNGVQFVKYNGLTKQIVRNLPNTVNKIKNCHYSPGQSFVFNPSEENSQSIHKQIYQIEEWHKSTQQIN